MLENYRNSPACPICGMVDGQATAPTPASVGAAGT